MYSWPGASSSRKTWGQKKLLSPLGFNFKRRAQGQNNLLNSKFAWNDTHSWIPSPPPPFAKEAKKKKKSATTTMVLSSHFPWVLRPSLARAGSLSATPTGSGRDKKNQEGLTACGIAWQKFMDTLTFGHLPKLLMGDYINKARLWFKAPNFSYFLPIFQPRA